MWLDRGFALGNHTFSHPDLNRTEIDAYKHDIVLGERITSALLAEHHRQTEQP